MVGLIAWGRFFKTDSKGNVSTVTVPAPSTDPGKPWLADFLRSEAPALGASFDFVQWPPVSKAQGGDGEGCDGYGIFDPYDIGSKNQQGSVPTRYGTAESLLAAVAALNAHGVQSYGDLVLHQRIGENGGPGVFKYLGSDNKTLNGRGGTTPSMFRGGTGNNDPVPPFCKEDDVAGGSGSDTPFGREISYQHCTPPGITTRIADMFIQWLTARVDFAGYRYDDVKGTWPPAVANIMNNSWRLPFYAEYYDGNPANLNWWATSYPMKGRSAVVDFCFHYRAQAACNGFDATQFFGGYPGGEGGYWQWNPGLSVLFMDNPDTDVSNSNNGQIASQIVFNKAIGYAVMLTLPARDVLVYGKDYFHDSVWPGAYGLKPLIDNMCWINRTFAFGALRLLYVDKDVLVLYRDGNGGATGWSGGLLTAINFNVLSERTVTIGPVFGPNRWLHDYTGHAGDTWTNNSSEMTITIPSNAFSGGESYVMYAPGGVTGPFPASRRLTQQTFFGAADLDVAPARNGLQHMPQRIFCAANSRLEISLDWSKRLVTAQSSLRFGAKDPSGTDIINVGVVAMGLSATTHAYAAGETTEAGWYTLFLDGSELPAEGTPFELKVTYTGAAS